MRPDERRRQRKPRSIPADAQPIPFDAASDPDGVAVEALQVELALAGRRARDGGVRAGLDRPDPAFATALRLRLLARYEPLAVMPDTPTTRAHDRTASRARGRVSALRLLEGLPTRRWAVVALAAAVVVLAIGSSALPSLRGTFDARASDAVAATLVRAGDAMPLVAGAALQARDEIRVTVGGRATLALGRSLARLQGGADVRLDSLTGRDVRLELLAGRTYHRVTLPDGGTYRVTTGAITWSAVGTAFDLDRTTTQDGRDRITLLGLQHGIRVVGPGLATSVDQGRAATLTLSDLGPSDLVVGPIDAATLADPWLVDNARADRALGLDLGALDGSAPEPTPAPTASERPAPTVGEPPAEPSTSPGAVAPVTTPEPIRKPEATPASKSTSRPDPEPAQPPAAPTPKPTPKPPAQLGLGLVSCDGGVVIDWSAYHGGRFDHYATFRDTKGVIPKTDPSGAGASVVEGSSTTERWQTSVADTTGQDGTTYFYRTVVFGRSGKVTGASPVRSALARPVAELGALQIGPADGQKTAFTWTPYSGRGDCFTWYKLAVSRIDPKPSVLKGESSVFASSDQGVSEAVAELPAGTYHFRLQVLRSTEVGSPGRFLVAQTDATTYVVP